MGKKATNREIFASMFAEFSPTYILEEYPESPERKVELRRELDEYLEELEKIIVKKYAKIDGEICEKMIIRPRNCTKTYDPKGSF